MHKAAVDLPADTPLAERFNMVFIGTHLAAGRGRAVVVATGLDTEVGKAAQGRQLSDQSSISITHLTHYLSIGVGSDLNYGD